MSATVGIPDRTTRALPWWVAASVVLVALNLRPSVVGVGPLLAQIRADEALTATAAGVLTALPVLCFGLLAPVAPRLARRIGIERALLTALGVLILGCVVRALPGAAALFGGTVLIGAAIATGNVLMPALVKRDFAHRTGAMTAAYSAAISVGGALGAAVTAPVADGLGLGWRAALAAWALWAVAAALCWLPQLRRVARPAATAAPVAALRRSTIAWQVTAFMGLQSLGFYATTSWLPEVFTDRGYPPATAGVLVATMSLTGIAGGMAAPVLAARARRQRGLAVAITATTALGLAGVLLLPGWELAACIVLGIGQGAALGLALTLMTVRASDSAHAAQLSGMAQCLGYLLAATGPFAVGLLHDLTAGWTVPLVTLLLLLVPQAVLGALAGRDKLV
ncbi:CynX/NimT family MFS transporter [Pseudonocardia sp. CA-107938]|uniref:CynX/NimT family MFS transporter n=1 Tax=Pseudonocardia sp. CA-107938 TaxID=3240021 RepID=UPI003D8CB92F